MLTFPLFNAFGFKGSCHIHNFSPNNWEKVGANYSYVSILKSNNNLWILERYEEIKRKDSIQIKIDSDSNNNYQNGVSHSALKIAMLSKEKPKSSYDLFPTRIEKTTQWPEWRSTIGLSKNGISTYYQGEISPFPPHGNLLSIHPFIQSYPNKNYFIFVNFEKSPVPRSSKLKIISSLTKKTIYDCQVYNNCCNVVDLNLLAIKQKDLPMFCCQTMTGIPFGLTSSNNCGQLSFEHTHPPGSIILGANRFKFQKRLKNKWLTL